MPRRSHKLRDNRCAGSHVEAVGYTQHGDVKNLHTFPSDRGNYAEEIRFLKSPCTEYGARGGAVGCDTALQAGKSRVRFPLVSLEFSLT